LESLGYRTVTADDGESALAACFEHNPDLCILDVSMPAGELEVEDRATGFEVCRRIKRDPRTSRIPVIFVTALNETSDRVKGIEAGGDDFLTKPHNRLILGARVRSLLKLKATTDALDDSLRKLRELEKVREDLMKMIVHDLKTPLTLVLATLEMLGDGDFGAVTDRQKAAVADAETKSEDLLALIEDILEVAKIEEASIKLTLAPMAPGALIAELVHEWQHRFHQEKTEIRVSVADDAPVFAGDKPLIKRVFSNLIQNAITHSSGPILLQLSARATDSGVLFTVSDNGPGIPPEYHELIFRKFGQVGMQRIPRTRSSGLGLTFCKLVVEMHGGRIWVQSSGGEGSAFHIELPTDAGVASSPPAS
ncbi:MAG: hybrid sensor histidine kinase/response regulator, partial [Gemmatimonadota bacterium]|nr:hybrid sensor histidine kinase/response regulator [Gemmatimonadota bacterium]